MDKSMLHVSCSTFVLLLAKVPALHLFANPRVGLELADTCHGAVALKDEGDDTARGGRQQRGGREAEAAMVLPCRTLQLRQQ